MNIVGSGPAAGPAPKKADALKSSASAKRPAPPPIRPASVLRQALPNTMPLPLTSIMERYLHGISPTDIKSNELFANLQKADSLLEKLGKNAAKLPSNAKDLLAKNPEYAKDLEKKLAAKKELTFKEDLKTPDGLYTGFTHPAGLSRTPFPHRLGILQRDDKSTQEGWFKDGDFVNGTWTNIHDPGGIITLDGSFQNNELTGPGGRRTDTYSGGGTTVFEGSFQNNELTGPGGRRTDTRPDGTTVVFEGSFQNNKLTGSGGRRTDTYSDGTTVVLEGPFQNNNLTGRPGGRATETRPDGTTVVLESPFQNNKLTGRPGRMCTVTLPDGSTRVTEGTFRDGKFILTSPV